MICDFPLPNLSLKQNPVPHFLLSPALAESFWLRLDLTQESLSRKVEVHGESKIHEAGDEHYLVIADESQNEGVFENVHQEVILRVDHLLDLIEGGEDTDIFLSLLGK